MTDCDGILPRIENKYGAREWNGIALGSVWDEKIAGTNGVSIALSSDRGFTISGDEHFYRCCQTNSDPSLNVGQVRFMRHRISANQQEIDREVS